MTPREKAIELFMKFEKHTYEHPAMSSKELRDEVKICCLIAVDEIRKLLYNSYLSSKQEREFWNSVKNEIEKL